MQMIMQSNKFDFGASVGDVEPGEQGLEVTPSPLAYEGNKPSLQEEETIDDEVALSGKAQSDGSGSKGRGWTCWLRTHLVSAFCGALIGSLATHGVSTFKARNGSTSITENFAKKPGNENKNNDCGTLVIEPNGFTIENPGGGAGIGTISYTPAGGTTIDRGDCGTLVINQTGDVFTIENPGGDAGTISYTPSTGITIDGTVKVPNIRWSRPSQSAFAVTVKAGAVADCDGHSITGDKSTNGIYVEGDGATIINCDVTNFSLGLGAFIIAGGKGVSIENSSFSSNYAAGIGAYSMDNLREELALEMKGVRAFNNGFGVFLDEGGWQLFLKGENSFDNNDVYGLQVDNSNGFSTTVSVDGKTTVNYNKSGGITIWGDSSGVDFEVVKKRGSLAACYNTDYDWITGNRDHTWKGPGKYIYTSVQGTFAPGIDKPCK